MALEQIRRLERAPSSSDRFAQAFSNAGQTAAQLIPQEMLGAKERKQLSRLLGEDVSDIRSEKSQELLLKGHQDRKLKLDEMKRKLTHLEKLKNSEYWEKLPEDHKQLLQAEILGDISAQSAKSYINAGREAQDRQMINNLLGLGDSQYNQSPNMQPEAMNMSLEPEDMATPDRSRNRGAKQGIQSLPQDKLFALLTSKTYAPVAQAELDRRNKEKDLDLKKQERNFKRNEKFLNRIDESEKGIHKMDIALTQMEAMMNSGDFGNWQNILGDMTGLEFLKSASAQVGNSATKEFLMGGLADITGRPNQFIEKSLTQAVINPLYKEEANKAIFEGLRIMQDLRKKELEISRSLEEKFVEEQGEIPRNFQKLVQDSVNDYANPILNGYQEELKSLLNKDKKIKKLEGDRLSLEEIFG